MDMNKDMNENTIQEFEIPQEEVQKETSSTSSRRKKERVKKKRRKKRYGFKFLIFVAVCVGLYFFAHSAVFTVDKVVLAENDRFSLESVQETTGIKKGQNLFDIKMRACEDKLEESPYIRNADVRRKLPGTVEITLDLREPAAVVLHGEKYVLIDEEGVVLEIRDTLPHYTVFDLLTVEEAKEGEVIVVKEKEKYDKYQELLGYMQDADLYFRRFVMDDSGIIRLYVKSELKCEGTEENLVAGMKDGNLKAVLYNLSESGYEKGVVTVGDDQYYSYSKTFK